MAKQGYWRADGSTLTAAQAELALRDLGYADLIYEYSEGDADHVFSARNPAVWGDSARHNVRVSGVGEGLHVFSDGDAVDGV